MDRLIAQRRFNMTLLVLFGGLGLVIAGAGIYGVMAYIVAQRTGEIGVRMALGATRAHVVSMVLKRAGVMMAASISFLSSFFSSLLLADSSQSASKISRSFRATAAFVITTPTSRR